MDNSTERRVVPHLFALLADYRGAFRQERPYERAVGLVLAQLFAFGRHTVTQLLLALGLGEADWSAWYRLFSQGRYQEEACAKRLLGQLLEQAPTEAPFVVVADGVQIPRSSTTMPGSSWLKTPRTPPWKPGIHRAQRFVHLAWLVPLVAGFSRAVPLRWVSAFPEKACAAREAARTEWQAALAGLGWLRAQLNAGGRAAQPVLVLVDGNYDTVGFWKGLPQGVVALARTAKNRVLYELPGAYSGTGRRRKYGARAPTPGAVAAERRGWQRVGVTVRGHLRRQRYRLVGPLLRERAAEVPLFLLVVGGEQYWVGRGSQRCRRRRAAIAYLVSAVPGETGWELPLPVERLLAWAWQRWEVEVAHREMKTTWGIGDTQCWNPRATVAAVQFAVWSYALFVLAGYRAWGLLNGPAVPSAWWRGARRWSFMTLWRAFRRELWHQPDFRAVWLPTGDNWPKKEAGLQALANASHAASKG